MTSPLPKPVRHASVVLGHVLQWDPPAAATAIDRWTCVSRTCGRAVLVRPDGTGYGSALDSPCEPPAPED